jgi:hypothetical protein
MPRIREDKHQAVCARAECGKIFFQRKPNQIYCSQGCSNKEFPGIGGRKPVSGLEQRICENPDCAKLYQPYRASQRVCSRSCLRKLPDVVEKSRTHRAQQHVKDRKNAARRGSVRVREYNRRTQLARYGTTPEEYAARLEAQAGLCMICGGPPKPEGIRAESKLHQDHDHVTKRNRDLLCANCNKGLGCFGDDPERLRAAAAYVERHREQPNKD